MSSPRADRWPPAEPALQGVSPRGERARPEFQATLRDALISAPPTSPALPLAPLALLAAVGLLTLVGWMAVGRRTPDAAMPAPLPVATAAAASGGFEPASDEPAGPPRMLDGSAKANPIEAGRPTLPPTAAPTRAVEMLPAPPIAAIAPVDVSPAQPTPTESLVAAPPPTERRAKRRDDPSPTATPPPTDAPVVLPATPTPRWTDAPTPEPLETSATPATPEPPPPPSP